MPLEQRVNIDKKTLILIWDVKESIERLNKNLKLSKSDELRLQKRKTAAHQKQFLASRRLLMEAGVSFGALSFDKDGIPHLESGQYISISHTRNLAGIALGNKILGFDLELYRPKIEFIANRFLNPNESFALEGKRTLEKLTLIWTAKEALYKAMKQKGIIFSKQLIIEPFKWGDRNGIAKVIISDKIFDFSLKFIVEKTYCGTLAYRKKLNKQL